MRRGRLIKRVFAPVAWLAAHLRADVIPAAVRGTPLHVYVGGQTAGFEDFSANGFFEGFTGFYEAGQG